MTMDVTRMLAEAQRLAARVRPEVGGFPYLAEVLRTAGFDTYRCTVPAVIAAIRADQAGHTSFPEFLNACWRAGVTDYEVDLRARTCTYHGVATGDQYVEAYPAITLPAPARP
nr:DUF1398 family protein [Frankia gtarii]